MDLRIGKVLVTGASGHLGRNLLPKLLERGLEVRASFRPPLKEKPSLSVEWVESQLLNLDSLMEAMEGIEGVFHLAAPTMMWHRKSRRMIYEPIVEGTRNVLKAAIHHRVQKIVYTGTCAAVGGNATSEDPLTENNWFESAQTPYARAKLQAERLAAKMSEAARIDFASICPPSVIGPGMARHTPSTDKFELLLKRKLPFLPRLGFHYADVRDVASAHCEAMLSPSAKGRYIVAGQFMTMDKMGRLLERLDTRIRAPRILPNWMMPAISKVDWMKNILTGAPREISPEIIRDFIGKEQHLSSDRARRDLNWNPRPLEASVRDTIDWIDHHMASR